MNWYLDVLTKKYAQFTGRARRMEFWMFALVNVLISIGLSIIGWLVGFPYLDGIYGLAVLVPGIAVTVRRLHDTNRSGWWALIAIIPIVGFIVLLVFTVQPGDRGANPYGDDPLPAV